MSLSTLAKARAILDEVARREQERALERFVPSPPQARFFTSPAFIRVFSGANNSGKSTALVADGMAEALGYEPWTRRERRNPPARVMFVAESFLHAAGQDLIPIIQRFLPKSMIAGSPERMANGRIHMWHLKNGSLIKLMSYDQEATEFEGTKWSYIGFNEPPPRKLWAPCLRGATKGDGRIAFAATPVGADSAWMVVDLLERADGEYVDWITADGEHTFFASEAAKVKFEAGLDSDEREARLHGRPQSLTGRVYKQFDEGRHVLRGDAAERVRAYVADPAVPKGLVIDPHDRRPFAMAWFLVTPSNEIVFFHEWPDFEFHRAKSCDLDVPAYADLIRRTEADLGITITWRLMDPNYGVSRRVISNESIRDAFDRQRLSFDTDIDDKVADGHTAVKQLLNEDRLFLVPECRNLLFAFRFYCWKEDADKSGLVAREQPAEIGKDFADLVRYAAMRGCRYFDPRERARLRNQTPTEQLVP